MSPAAGRSLVPRGRSPSGNCGCTSLKHSPGVGVGTEIDQVQAVVTIDELDQLTAGIPGGTENRRANHHESPSIRICEWSAAAVRREVHRSASGASHVSSHMSHVDVGRET